MDGGQGVPVLRGRGDAQRVFILTHGRTGSTLLAAILADCGAGFGMPVPADWDARCGDLEHPGIQAATLWLGRAHAIAAEKPTFGWRRGVWAAYRSRGKRNLRAVLAQARYLKCVNLDLAVYEAFRLGYRPSVVLSYRRFEDCAISDSLNNGSADLSSYVRRYNRTYRNGMLQISTFGGCAIGFDQLVDPDDTSWAGPLERVTGFAAERLIAARACRLKAIPHAAPVNTLDHGAGETFAAVDALRGAAFAPSAPVLRYARAAARPVFESKYAGD
jgi:hypothetical protein